MSSGISPLISDFFIIPILGAFLPLASGQLLLYNL